MNFRFFAALLALTLIVAGCDKATDANSNSKPVFAVVAISVPAANFTDTCNAPAYSYASLAQALVQYAAAYASLPGGTNNNGTWTWSMSDGGITITITARKLSDGQYEWKTVLNGSDGTDTYSNWTAFDGTVSADGKNGTLNFYDDTPTPSTTVEARVTWSTGSNNMVTMEYESVADLMKFILITNGTTGDVRTYNKVGSAWVADGYHAVWSTPGALATC